eukprot:Em0361g3a
MMENVDKSFSESNRTNVSVELLPDLAVIFTPMFILQLLVGLVSNLLLFALLVKATNVKNNINIYLCSMAVNNLLSLFLLLTLVVSTVTRRWILGPTTCTINQVIIYMVSIPTLVLPVLICRERYKAVIRFTEWKPYTRRTYLEVGVVWICALGGGMVGLFQGGQIAGETDGVISCYAPNRWLKERLSPLFLAYMALGCVTGTGALLFGAIQYAYVFRALRVIKKDHTYSSAPPLRRNCEDAPINWESELRTLNTMAFVFVMTAVPFTMGSSYGTAVAAVAITKGITYAEANVPLLQLASLFLYLFPTVSPMVIVMVNKRFRSRIKDLIRWQLKPDNVATCAAVIGNTDSISHCPFLLLSPVPWFMLPKQPGGEGLECISNLAITISSNCMCSASNDPATRMSSRRMLPSPLTTGTTGAAQSDFSLNKTECLPNNDWRQPSVLDLSTEKIGCNTLIQSLPIKEGSLPTTTNKFNLACLSRNCTSTLISPRMFSLSPEAAHQSCLPDSRSFIRLPDLAVTPMFILQLLVGLVSNLLLFALLVKATNVKNNINIYLCSMAVNNLLSLFLLLTLVVSTVTRRWILGPTTCTINQVIIYVVSIPTLVLPVLICRERYKAVIRFTEWKPYTRRTYLEVGVVWICALGGGMVGLFQGGQIAGETDGVISCYAPNRWLKERLSPLFLAYMALGCVTGTGALLFGAIQYAYVFRALRVIKKDHTYSSAPPLRRNCEDAPINWESELRTLNTMAFVFVMTAVPFTMGSSYGTAVAAVAITKGITYAEANVPLLQLASLFLYLFPTIIARPSFSIWEYFFSAGANEREANAIGLSEPSSNRPFPAVVPSAMVHASEAAGGEGLECQPTCGGTFHSSSLALEMNVTEECSEYWIEGNIKRHLDLFNLIPAFSNLAITISSNCMCSASDDPATKISSRRMLPSPLTTGTTGAAQSDLSPEAAHQSCLPDSRSFIRLPDLAVTPMFILQLLVGLVSNLLLFALLVKATNVKNNINIYLCSMAVNNLLSLFLLLTLVVSTVTRRWILGPTTCTINQVIIYVVSIPTLVLPVLICRERYKAVIRFTEWKPYTRRTYLEVGVVWICALGGGMVGLFQGGQIAGETDGVISCYAPNRWLKERLSPLFLAYMALGCVTGTGALLFGAIQYAYVFRALRVIKKDHTYSSAPPLRRNCEDAPINWESELRTLNTMAFVFVMTAVPFTMGSSYGTAVAAVAITKGITYAEANVPLLQLASLFLYLFPTVSPMVIVMVNKRFRSRIKDLIRWQLKPDNVATCAAVIGNTDSISHLDERDRIALLTYNTSVKQHFGLQEATAENKQIFQNVISSIIADGRTNLCDCLTKVYTFAFGNDCDHGMMQAIASHGKGACYFINSLEKSASLIPMSKRSGQLVEPDCPEHPVTAKVGGKAQPTLREILYFSSKTKTVNLAQQIGIRGKDLGVYLLEDDSGAIVEGIAAGNKSIEDTNREILIKWLQGSGMQPVAWSTLTKAMRKVELFHLAAEVDEAMKAEETKVDERDCIALLTYNTSVKQCFGLQEATAENKQIFQNAISTIIADGRTNLCDGLMKGVEMLAYNGGTKPATVQSVLLLSDGEATEGVTVCEKILKKMNQVKCYSGSVYTFAFGNDCDLGMMQAIASHGKGVCYFIDSLEKVI